MGSKSLYKSWDRTKAHLERAVDLLPSCPVRGDEGGSVSQCHVYIEHYELGLALEELELIGEANEVPKAFWQALLAAAEEMKLNEPASRYKQLLPG